jgi:hypothetical protein
MLVGAPGEFLKRTMHWSHHKPIQSKSLRQGLKWSNWVARMKNYGFKYSTLGNQLLPGCQLLPPGQWCPRPSGHLLDTPQVPYSSVSSPFSPLLTSVERHLIYLLSKPNLSGTPTPPVPHPLPPYYQNGSHEFPKPAPFSAFPSQQPLSCSSKNSRIILIIPLFPSSCTSNAWTSVTISTSKMYFKPVYFYFHCHHPGWLPSFLSEISDHINHLLKTFQWFSL